MSAQHLRLILTESPALICDIHACNPELSILRDFALERIADGTWDPKAQFPAHSLLAWAEARALEHLMVLPLQPHVSERWQSLIRSGRCPDLNSVEFRGRPTYMHAWMRYNADLHDFRHAHYEPCRLTGAALPPPEYPRPEGEILRELEAAEDAARWAHLMQLWTARTGKLWGQS